jgi:hypothetical protein
MRRKPLTRNDVRIEGINFVAVPVDAYQPQKPVKKSGRWRVPAFPSPIESLWKPLIEELEAESARIGELRGKPITWEIPQALDQPRTRGTCRHCGRPFFRLSRISIRHVGSANGQVFAIEKLYLPQGQYCSNHCATKARTAGRTAARAAARAARCDHCGEPMKAERSSKRYCSERCRVAAHRRGG